MKQIIVLVLNSITLVFTLALNYLVGTGNVAGATVGEISAQYDNLFTPAGYAFAIWGIIYILLIVFAGYQWYEWIKHRNSENINRTGIWFILSNLANGMWIIAWTGDRIGLSFGLILILLISLIMLMLRLRLEIWDAPMRIIAFVWWPVCIYIGWIVVATMANFAAYSVKLASGNSFALQQAWVVVLIVFACLVYIALIFFRNMREAAFVGIWAFIAIAVKQWQNAESVVYAALSASVVLFIYSSWQAYKNRETLPFKKIKRGEI